MKISYNWLKEYIDIDLEIDKVSEILTDIGLEVEGVHAIEMVKGGLSGVVVGEIKEISQHPNADRLQLTKVDVGHADLLDIVCGAPNVAAGQKVIVALVGTTLYPTEEGFKIKKSKIRGEVSEGMLCAEDELGLGKSHDGILVLEKEAKVGQPAAEYFDLKNDSLIEIGLTPNRVDAASHYGVARDLAAFLGMTEEVKLKKPNVSSFKVDSNELTIPVKIHDVKACPRYSALTLTDVKVAASPEWLQNRLRAIGLKPLNNVVDVTNFVLHELGQPLHAFDADQIEGKEVHVKQLAEETIFTTLDGVERKLSNEDLMICDNEKGMCLAGVFGGSSSGVTSSTTSVFLESAYFNSVSVRKTAKRHGLNTDASFRYERGADPDITVFALKRAALLLKEIAGAKVSSEIIDYYPEEIEDVIVDFTYDFCDTLIGFKIGKNIIKSILSGLEIKILDETKKGLRLKVPAYRVDVQREVDVVEEILRIYGYNRIPLPAFLRSSILTNEGIANYQVENIIADYLASNGFNEIFTNSLTNPKYYGNSNNLVEMVNPLSKELEVLRKSMLSGGMEVIAYNQNRKRKNLKFFEFGKTYESLGNSEYAETLRLGLWLTGNQYEESWQGDAPDSSFYQIKEFVTNCLQRLGVTKWKVSEGVADNVFETKLELQKGKTILVTFGSLTGEKAKSLGVKERVFFAEFNWSAVLNSLPNKVIKHKEVIKYPSVRRDLALLIDDSVEFDSIHKIAKQAENRVLKEVNLFDVYEGSKLAKGKKSYGVSFVFQDDKKTLTDDYIDKIMTRMMDSFKKELGAELR